MRKAISLFTGAGGMDIGFEKAGFETVAAVEHDSDAVITLRHNREFKIFDADIHAVESSEIMRESNVTEGHLDLLHGGPPCQPFSKSGYWAGGDAKRLEDPRATTLEAYLRILRDLKPEAFVLENVAGLAYKNKSEGMDLLRQTIESINRDHGTCYSFEFKLLNAADYGVPQERERVFIVGHREGLRFEFPDPTHERFKRGSGHQYPQKNKAEIPLTGLSEATNCWDAIGDLENDDDPSLHLSGKWAELLPSVPEGCNYLFHTDRGDGMAIFGWRRRYWSFLLKLSKEYPSWTLTANPGSAIGPFHWKNRWLSIKELARLQTFPDDYEIIGSRRAGHKQLGNAVPSALAEVIGLELRRQFWNEQVSKPTLLPIHKTTVPAIEEIQLVPKKYHPLVGSDSAHPGTGKGRGATSS